MMGAFQLVMGCLPQCFYLLQFLFAAFLPALLPWEISRDGAPGGGSLVVRQGAQWKGGALLGTQEADILLLPRVFGSYFLIN